MRSRFIAIFLVTCLALAGAASALAADVVSGVIKVAKLTGSVTMTIKATGTVTKLTEDSLVSEGAVVSTAMGSSVILVFSNGATVNLAEDSELDIAKFSQDPFSSAFSPSQAKAEPTTSVTRLNLIHGDLVTKVLHLNVDRGSEFVVQTPVGAAGIRGTTFRIIYRINAATGTASYSLVALEGRVRVTLATGTVNAPPLEVTGGNQVVVVAKVSIDASGNITVTPPSGQTTTIVTKASTATVQEVAAAANVITQAVANVVLAPPAGSTQQSTPAPKNDNPPNTQPVNPTVVSPSQ